MIFLYHIKIVLLRIGKKMNDANLAMIDTQTDSIQYLNCTEMDSIQYWIQNKFLKIQCNSLRIIDNGWITKNHEGHITV